MLVRAFQGSPVRRFGGGSNGWSGEENKTMAEHYALEASSLQKAVWKYDRTIKSGSDSFER